MNNLNQVIITFLNNKDFDPSNSVFTEIRKNLSSDSRLRKLSRAEVQKELMDRTQIKGHFNALLWKLRKLIGGGLAELHRDFRNMNSNQICLLIDVKDLKKEKVALLKSKISNPPFFRSKYINKLGVEHLTIETQHRAEAHLFKNFDNG